MLGVTDISTSGDLRATKLELQLAIVISGWHYTNILGDKTDKAMGDTYAFHVFLCFVFREMMVTLLAT